VVELCCRNGWGDPRSVFGVTYGVWSPGTAVLQLVKSY
jgi:hypothetical protein